MTKCSICNDFARRDLVNNSLLTGDSPAAILKRYGAKAAGSQSALYRHAQHFQKTSALVPKWVSADVTAGEVVADLGQLRRALLDDYVVARASGGSSVAATRAAREVTNVSVALIRSTGFDSEEAATTLGNHAELLRILARAALERPAVADELAAAAEAVGLREWPAELRKLARSASAVRSRDGGST